MMSGREAQLTPQHFRGDGDYGGRITTGQGQMLLNVSLIPAVGNKLDLSQQN